MEKKIQAKVTETEENTAISQETEKTQTTSQEIAETEEMNTISDEKAEIADDQKTEKNEVNSEKTEEMPISPEDAAKLAKKRKIIDKEKAPMEESRPDEVAKMEDNQETEKNQTTSKEIAEMIEEKKLSSDKKAEMADNQKTVDEHDSSHEAEEMAISPEGAAKIAKRKMIAKGKATMVEEEQLNNFEDLYTEFLAEPNSESDSDEIARAMSWSAAEMFFIHMGAWDVYSNFRKALEYANIEVISDDELEPHRSFLGILMIFFVHYHKKEKGKEVVLKLLKKYMIGNGLKCDVIGFVDKYRLESRYIISDDILKGDLDTLQRAMLLVMCIFEEADKVDEPANLVAEAILDAYDTWIWGDEVFGTIYRFLRCPYKTLVVVGLVLVTALALSCKERNRPDLSRVIYQNKFVEVVHKMDTPKLSEAEVVMRVTACVDALKGMPKPLKSWSSEMELFAGPPNKMTEEQKTAIDRDIFKKLIDDEADYLCEYDLNVSTFLILKAPTVNDYFSRALYWSGNIDEVNAALDDFADQSSVGSVAMLCVYAHHFFEKERLPLVLKFLKSHMIESKCDFKGFTEEYKTQRIDLPAALSHAMFYVLCIFNLANEVDAPALILTTVAIDAWLSGVWDDGLFYNLANFLLSGNSTLRRVAFIVVKVVANLYKQKYNEELLLIIHTAGIVEAMRNMDFTKLSEEDRKRATVCSEALGELPEPP